MSFTLPNKSKLEMVCEKIMKYYLNIKYNRKFDKVND